MTDKYLPIELLNPENIRRISYPINKEEYDRMHNYIKKSVISDYDEENESDQEDNINKKNNTDEENESDQEDNSNEKMTIHILGILVDGRFHKYEKPNCFLSEPMDLPENYTLKASVYNMEGMIGEVYDPKICTCNMNNPKTYITEDNGGAAFKVEIDHKKLVKIYSYPKKIIPNNIPCESCMLSDFLIQYEPEKIFIGKSMLIPMTKFSGGYGDGWDGNSILLFMGMYEDKYKYISIGTEIFSFCIKEEVIEYHSPVGNSRVPYPFCLTENYIYDFCFGVYNRSDIHDNGKEGLDYEYDGNIDHLNLLTSDNSIVSDITKLYPRSTDKAIYQPRGYYITSKFHAGTKFSMVENTC